MKGRYFLTFASKLTPMDFLPEDIVDYAEAHSADESVVLKELNRETNAHVLMPRMLSGHLQGRILSMFSHMVKPLVILEIGTYTGYSAICLAEGLAPGGILHTIDINEELADMAKEYVEKAGFQEKIRIHTGDAIQLIPGLPGPFDLVFIDADKENYSRYYEMVLPILQPGGYILADNVLWSGRVLEPEAGWDEETRAIHAFNNRVQRDPRVENVLIPVRDGLMVIRKKMQDEVAR